MSDVRKISIGRHGQDFANEPGAKTGPGFFLHSFGAQGSWLVVVWARKVERTGDKYKEFETQFYNQSGELIATYFESTLFERKVADEPQPEKKP